MAEGHDNPTFFPDSSKSRWNNHSLPPHRQRTSVPYQTYLSLYHAPHHRRGSSRYRRRLRSLPLSYPLHRCRRRHHQPRRSQARFHRTQTQTPILIAIAIRSASARWTAAGAGAAVRSTAEAFLAPPPRRSRHLLRSRHCEPRLRHRHLSRLCRCRCRCRCG